MEKKKYEHALAEYFSKSQNHKNFVSKWSQSFEYYRIIFISR